MGNELFRRKVKRKATKKPKRNVKQLKVQMGKGLSFSNFKTTKEQWIDELRYKKLNWKNVSKKERQSKTTSSSSVTKKVFSKHWKETTPEEDKCLKLRNSSNFGVVFERKTKENQICAG